MRKIKKSDKFLKYYYLLAPNGKPNSKSTTIAKSTNMRFQICKIKLFKQFSTMKINFDVIHMNSGTSILVKFKF